MNRLILAFSIMLLAQLLPAQDVTYVIFNRDCMSQLVYRYAYPNVKGDEPVYAYSIRPNVLENYVFMVEGSGHYSPSMPAGAVSCSSLNLSDGYVAALNRNDRQMLVVFQRQEGGYWLMPIGSATLVARSGPKYWVRSKNCSFTFDTLRMENDINLAVTGSPTAVYFSGAQIRNCLMEYAFHCESPKVGQIRSDIELIPSLGFSSDRTGLSSAKALENEMKLYRVNGQFIDDFIGDGCPEAAKIAISKNQPAAQYGYDKETYGYSEADKETVSIKTNNETDLSPAHYNYEGEIVLINCPEKLGNGYHVVQKGENLRAIARTYNVDVPALVKWNKIQDPNIIEICDIIWYQPPPAGFDKSTLGVAPKPRQYSTDNNMVIDQRKLRKIEGSDKGLAPQVYSTNDPNYDSWSLQQAQNKATTTTDARPLIHTVQKGEYLYKIARMYDCPDDCIRRANKMPESGNVTLNVGERVIIPECNCLNNTNLSKNTPYDEPVNTYAKKQKNSEGTVLDPVNYNYQENPEGKTLTDEWRIDVDNKVASSLSSKTTGKKPTTESSVPQFKEHLARQGDTIRSIATKYKVDPAELAQVNGLGLNEAITPGKWILVPIHN